jgi:protein involved in polysaccharide export with SLBB domain
MKSSPGAGTNDTERLLQMDNSSLSSSAIPPVSTFPTDNVVSAEHYMLGPGDVLMLEIVGPLPVTLPLTVSPENIVLLPRLGEINVDNKTLAETKVAIQRLVQARNPNNRAYLALQRARTVYVRITGNVAVPGMYALPASMRISSAVAIANQESSPLAMQRSTAERRSLAFSANANANTMNPETAPRGQYSIPLSQRSIKVLHRTGESMTADALRARLSNNPAADPPLREADEIYVPFDYEATGVSPGMLSIAGAVQRPCLVPFRAGDRLSILLKAAYGLQDNADSAAVLVFDGISAGASTIGASTISARSSGARTFSVAWILSGEQDVELQAGTSVVVKAKENSSEKRSTVSVLGEVAFPGVYVITDGETRLTTAIERAGGFTNEAYLPLSGITRRERSTMQNQANDAGGLQNAQYTTLTPEDTLRFRMDEAMRRPTVAMDFVQAFEQKSAADNVRLQDGDIITVATSPRNVFVFGQVNKPGFIEAGVGSGSGSGSNNTNTNTNTIDWYIRTAGGYAPNADTARMRVIKAKNHLWLEPRSASGAVTKGNSTNPITIEAGDQIYVPRVPDSNTDLALKRIAADLQRESLEVQKSNQTWTLVISVLATIFGAINLFAALQRP